MNRAVSPTREQRIAEVLRPEKDMLMSYSPKAINRSFQQDEKKLRFVTVSLIFITILLVYALGVLWELGPETLGFSLFST